MDTDAVRALTYNVRTDVSEDGEYDWDGRHAAVASTIRFHRPAVCGLQEPLAHQYDDLRAALPAYEWVGRSRTAAERGDEFCPVGYRSDRFACEDAGTFWLSETPDEPGSVGWDGSWPRIATWVRLRDRRTDATLVYLNTHLDHEGPRARREGARLLRERLPALRANSTGDTEGSSDPDPDLDPDPVVVAGDFNCTDDAEPYAVLAGTAGHESPLTDARTACPHPPHGPDTTRTDFESLRPDRRIDHVFVDGVAVENYGVAADVTGGGWYPSDHLPVVVDLTL